jgi:hypothetical protein
MKSELKANSLAQTSLTVCLILKRRTNLAPQAHPDSEYVSSNHGDSYGVRMSSRTTIAYESSSAPIIALLEVFEAARRQGLDWDLREWATYCH